MAELTQAEDVASAATGDAEPGSHSQQQQQQQPGSCPVASSPTRNTAAEDAGPTDATAGPAGDAEQTQAGDGTDPAAVLRGVQQQMVHLTMLLCSRNLWMRPAVLEAPAQDPQYLEAIHKVC